MTARSILLCAALPWVLSLGRGGAVGHAAPPPAIDLAELCAPEPKPIPIVSCLLLTEVPLARLGAERCARCVGTGTPCDPDVDLGGLRSDWWDYLRNCIYAAHGAPFRKREWREAFGRGPQDGRAWYRPRADFREADLTPLERANIAELRRRAARSPIATVSAADLARVRAWFREAKAGRPRLPSRLTDGETAVTRATARQWIAHRAPLRSSTAIYYSDGEAGSRRRTIAIADLPGPDCQVEDEICEGGFGIELTYEGTRLEELRLFGSG